MIYQAYPRYWGMGHGKDLSHMKEENTEKKWRSTSKEKKERNGCYIGNQGCLLSVGTGIPFQQGWCKNNISKFLENIWPKEDISWKLFFLLFSLSFSLFFQLQSGPPFLSFIY